MMPDRFLGFLDFIAPSKSRPVGKLRPLVALREDGIIDVLSTAMQAEQFPNTGRVSWYTMPNDVARNTLWWFTASEAHTYDQHKPTHDLMQVDTIEPAKEVIDCRPLGDVNVVRQLLTGRGLALHYTPSDRLYLWIEGELWIGPVSLVPHPSMDNLWRIDPMILQEHPLHVSAAPGEDSVVSIMLQGECRWLVIQTTRIITVGLRLDWASDDVLLKRVLRWIRSNDPWFTESVQLTQSTIDHMVERLREKGLGTDEGSLHQYRLERARAIVAELGKRATLVEDILLDVMHLPRVQAAIEERVEILAVTAREEAIATVSDAIAACQGNLADLEAKIARKWAEYQETEQLIADEQLKIEANRRRLQEEAAVLDARRETLRQEFESRVQQLVKEPGALLADLAILRLIAPGLQATPGSATPSARADSDFGAVSQRTIVPGDETEELRRSSSPDLRKEQQESKMWKARRDEVLLKSLHESRRALRATCRAAGIPGLSGLTVHAALLAGLCPVVVGADGLSLLEAYAQVITGGRFCWVPISPTVLDPTDLLGRPDGRGRMIPHPAGLLELLVQADQEPEVLSLVILDGITRAPVDTYLTPLLAWQATAHRGADARRLPICHPAALSPEDGFADCTNLQWPSNVLLAATLGQGATMLMPSVEFWSRAALIPLSPQTGDTEERREEGNAKGTVPSSVSLTQWTSWRNENVKDDSGLFDNIIELLPPEFGFGRDASGEYFLSAIMTLLGPSPNPPIEAIRALFLARIVPFAVSTGAWNLAEEALAELAKTDVQLGPAVRHARILLESLGIRP